jgi:hypothetical protein
VLNASKKEANKMLKNRTAPFFSQEERNLMKKIYSLRTVIVYLAILVVLLFGFTTSFADIIAGNDKMLSLRLIETKDIEEAEKKLLRLKNGEPFKKIATGEILEIRWADLRPEFKKALEGVLEGDYSGVFQVGSKFFIAQILTQTIAKEAEAKFDKPFTFLDKDEASKNIIKCTVTIYKGGTSTGGLIPKGMMEYEFGAVIENLTDSQVELNIGPVAIIDDKGKTYEGIFFRGPVQVFAGGMKMVLGKRTGTSSDKLTIGPKKKDDRPFIFVTIPYDAKPKDFTIVLGKKEPLKLHLKFKE